MAEPRQSRDVERPQTPVRDTNDRQQARSPQRAEPQRADLTRRSPAMAVRPGLSDPFAMMNALRRDIDQMFENFGIGGSLLRSPFFSSRDLDRGMGDLERSLWSPEVEVFEKDGKLHVCADLPGLEKDNVHVTVNENYLTIEGERRSERDDQQGGWSERSYGRFSRTIPLPDGIDGGKADAKFENGVLDIAFDAPRREEPRARKIEIK